MDNESYCGITGHWINDEWQMQSAAALECLQLVERHFAANVAEVYENFAADWVISSKLMAVVTDNARNMTAAVANTTFQHIPFLAHTLQLSILCDFKKAETNSLFAKCRKVVGHFKHSAANTTELEDCNNSDSPLLKLQQDVRTRWNSICIMMKSLLQAKDAMIKYMSAPCGKSFMGDKLLDSGWENMMKYAQVLELFCQTTAVLGGERYVSYSCVLPVIIVNKALDGP
jgi:zinc finger BED domain-containing protein 1 (E3 SUMO-protein ligase ZBED1)